MSARADLQHVKLIHSSSASCTSFAAQTLELSGSSPMKRDLFDASLICRSEKWSTLLGRLCRERDRKEKDFHKKHIWLVRVRRRFFSVF